MYEQIHKNIVCTQQKSMFVFICLLNYSQVQTVSMYEHSLISFFLLFENIKWRPPSLSKLALIVFNMELTH